MKRATWMGILCVFSALLLTSNGWARTYKIGVVPWAGFAPAQVAEANDFFQARELDVRVVSFPNSAAQRSALSKKLVDIGFNMIGTAIGWRIEGDPLVVIAETSWSHGGDKIIVKKDMAVDSLRQKPVGVYMNQPPILYFLNQYLSGIGVGLSDIRIVEMETDVLADKFIAGLFQVIVSYDPQAIRAEREGNGTVVATSATYEGTIPEGMMMREDVLSEFPEDDLEKIFEAWIEAVQWSHAQANWGEYMKILNDVTFRSDPPYSEADLREMISAVRVHDADVLVERNKDGGGLMAYLASLKEFLAENDRLEKDFDPSAVFRNGAIVKALGQ